MMGEELKSITISRDYFNNIFNSVTDMVFIVNTRGIIEDANQPAEAQLKYQPGTLKGKTITALFKNNTPYFPSILKELKRTYSVIAKEGIVYTRKGVRIPVQLNASYFKRTRREKQLVIVTASDITIQKQTENLIIRAIIDTQEKERHRLAKDLHDSLTQQLSAIKFYISSTMDLTKNQQQKTILHQSNNALTAVITDMRNLCFSLMPKTLEEFGLVKAVREFCNHFLYKGQVRFVVLQQNILPVLSAELKIDLYRIIQEFITNALRHGRATKVGIVFSYHQKTVKVRLTDNGKGFRLDQTQKGMGIQNMQSRIKSHNGTIHLESNIGKGTSFTITIPLNKYDDDN